jgi:hypothetical protein
MPRTQNFENNPMHSRAGFEFAALFVRHLIRRRCSAAAAETDLNTALVQAPCGSRSCWHIPISILQCLKTPVSRPASPDGAEALAQVET